MAGDVTHGLHATVGFHCQQEAEKRLKALLVALGVVPPRTHNLLLLLESLGLCGIDLSALEAACAELTPWATVSRYPGHGDLRAADAESAMTHAATVRAAVQRAFAGGA